VSRARRLGPAGGRTDTAVPPGSYTVKIERQGFRTHEQKKNVVNVGAIQFLTETR